MGKFSIFIRVSLKTYAKKYTPVSLSLRPAREDSIQWGGGKNLIRLGVEQGKAYAFSRTRKGGWAIAQSPVMTTTVTLNRLRKRGYESMLDYYQSVTPQTNPLF